MAFNRFDIATKELVWDGPAAWLERFGIGPPGPVDVIDSDITALTAVADKVIKVSGPETYLVNISLRSSHDKDLVATTLFRLAALYHRHKLPVLTVLVLLRREANLPSFTGFFVPPIRAVTCRRWALQAHPGRRLGARRSGRGSSRAADRGPTNGRRAPRSPR